MKRRCPVCRRVFEATLRAPSEAAKFFPFCSKRCKLLDLGGWLDSSYRIISSPESQEIEEPPDATLPPPSGRD
ncbi:MAG: DNA gyrase inhibitor YacG [Phycisphaerales bacterium]|nr:MAG: DNA gyrase inhibitor YacG [Phycisphaerales bacterium]